MIDTKELMLGNKLYYDNGAMVRVIDVEVISIDHINGEWNENFNPIELNNDWLAQLGVNPIRRRWYKRKFKYVHRLQNHFTNKFINQ